MIGIKNGIEYWWFYHVKRGVSILNRNWAQHPKWILIADKMSRRRGRKFAVRRQEPRHHYDVRTCSSIRIIFHHLLSLVNNERCDSTGLEPEFNSIYQFHASHSKDHPSIAYILYDRTLTIHLKYDCIDERIFFSRTFYFRFRLSG